MKSAALPLLVACATLLTAVPARAADPITEDVPIAGGLAALAEIADVAPVPDRARFVAELARVIYSQPATGPYSNEPIRRRIDAFYTDARKRGPAPEDVTVPVPLTAELWARAVFHRPVGPRDLAGAILTDRSAALLCYGLSGMDDDTLQFFSAHPSLLGRLADRAPAAVAAFGESLHVRGERVVPPGGADAAPLWEGVVGERLDHAEHFVQLLFETDRGRVAYFHDALAHLDAPALAFALESPVREPEERLNRFKQLAAVARRGFVEWDVTTAPFVRPTNAVGGLFARLRIDASGGLAGVTSPAFWQRVFDGGSGQTQAGGPADAAWLAELVLAHPARERERRADGLAFGQRVFAMSGQADSDDVATAVRALAPYPILMLTLERTGTRTPSIYVAAAQHAARLTELDQTRGSHALAQFQGAVALLSRLVRVRTLDVPAAERLARDLFAARLNDGRYNGAIAQWLDERVRPALAQTAASAPAAAGSMPVAAGSMPASIDDALLAAVAGPSTASGTTSAIEWEGQRYRVDVGGAELLRLQRVRDRQQPVRFDLALGLAAVARRLAETPATLDAVRGASATLSAAAAELAARTRPPVERERLATIRDAAQTLDGIRRPGDLSDARKVSAPLLALADVLLGEALVSLAYAGELGDPDGTSLIAGDPSVHHDFGYGMASRESRVKAMWGVAITETRNGPSHLVGSALALDLALAPLALRRIDTDRIPEAPMLNLVQRDAFAASVAAMDLRALTDDARDRITAFVELGEQRLRAIDPAAADAVAREINMDGWRARALAWTVRHEPASIATLFTMTERLTLGGGEAAAFNAWGTYVGRTRGCLCTELPAPGWWRSWWGLSQAGLPASLVSDLPLRVAVVLHNLHVPAVLARPVLAAAAQDFVDSVNPTDGNDWLTLARAAQAIPSQRFEDYVAAAAADGPLIPDASER